MRGYLPTYMARKKEELFDLLGHVCTRCGYGDKRALEFDHVEGGGNQHRKQLKSTIARYKHIRENLEMYRVLCRNCNWIVHLERQPVKAEYEGAPAGRPEKETPEVCPHCNEKVIATNAGGCTVCNKWRRRLYAREEYRRSRNTVA